jgi:hypothetical protein
VNTRGVSPRNQLGSCGHTLLRNHQSNQHGLRPQVLACGGSYMHFARGKSQETPNALNRVPRRKKRAVALGRTKIRAWAGTPSWLSFRSSQNSGTKQQLAEAVGNTYHVTELVRLSIATWHKSACASQQLFRSRTLMLCNLRMPENCCPSLRSLSNAVSRASLRIQDTSCRRIIPPDHAHTGPRLLTPCTTVRFSRLWLVASTACIY